MRTTLFIGAAAVVGMVTLGWWLGPAPGADAFRPEGVVRMVHGTEAIGAGPAPLAPPPPADPSGGAWSPASRRAPTPRRFTDEKGNRYAWWHRADFNRDGVLDAADLMQFERAWAAGGWRADANEDTRVDAADLAAFVQRFRFGEWEKEPIC